MLLSGTSGEHWRGGSSTCCLTTSHSPSLCTGSLMPSLHANSGTSPTCPSTHRISGTWLARRMWWPTAYLGPLMCSPCLGLTNVAGIKGPSRLLATPVARDGSPGASTEAVVTPGPVLDMAELARAQESCQETQELHAKLDAQDVLISGQKIWCDSSLGVLRPLVPVSMRRLVFNSMHSLAHPGLCATRRMLTSKFVWTSCSSDVNTWCREYQQCAHAKIQPQERAAVGAIQGWASVLLRSL